MLKPFRFVFLGLLVVLLTLSGCNFSEKANTLKDDLIDITKDQIAVQLENSLNEQFPGIQVNTPDILDKNGEVNWEELKQTELGNYVFYSIGDYEFKAVLSGDGTFRVVRVNNSSGESHTYAEFKAKVENGEFKVKLK